MIDNKIDADDDIIIPSSLRNNYQKIGKSNGIIGSINTEKVMKSVKIFKALSDPNRIVILKTLKIIHSCACMLKEVTGLPDSRLSYHLTILKKAGLISGNKEKNWIIYTLTEKGDQILLQINLVEIIK